MPTFSESRQRAKEEKLQAHKISDTEYIVYNVVRGSRYSVNQSTVTGTWYCSCPFATKSSRPGVCKHLARVIDKETGCEGCGAKDRPLTEMKCASCRFEDRMRETKTN